MRSWSFWDWVGYAAIAFAATFQAADAGLKQAPKLAAKMPSFIDPELAAFVPLALVVFGTVVLFIRHWRSPLDTKPVDASSENKSGETETDAVSSPDWDQRLEKHFRVRFQNETVLLDGHEFIDCHFENVTFKFDGIKPFRFTGKNTGNSRKVTTDNKIVGQTLTLALFLRPDLGLDYEVHKTGARLSQQTTSKSNGASDIASSSN